MKQEKKERCGCPAGICGKPQGPDLFRAGLIGSIHAFEHGSLHLHLAGGP